jgi:hypothetical protein
VKAVAAVVVALALLAGGFAAYRWLSGDDERDRAEAAAAEYSAFGKQRCDARHAERLALPIWQTPGARKKLDEETTLCKQPYDVLRIEQVDGDIWRFHVRDPGADGQRCMEVDLAHFDVVRKSSVYVGGTVEGLSDTPCGLDWWTPEYATRLLTDSSWAKERKAELIACSGDGSLGRSQYYRRFTCRYSTGRSDYTVTLRTTGVDTFDIANPS